MARHYYPMFGAILDDAPTLAEAERDEREIGQRAVQYPSMCPVSREDFDVKASHDFDGLEHPSA